jgi:hypothetical protein
LALSDLKEAIVRDTTRRAGAVVVVVGQKLRVSDHPVSVILATFGTVAVAVRLLPQSAKVLALRETTKVLKNSPFDSGISDRVSETFCNGPA